MPGERFDNFAQLFARRAAEHPSRPCQRFYRDGTWKDWSYAEVYTRVRAIAGGLAIAGIELGDRVAILSENCPEWPLVDLGCIAAGAVVVSVYAGLPAPDAAYIVDHSESRILFAENAEQLEKIRAVRGLVPRLERVVVLDDGATDDGFALPLGALERLATEHQIADRIAIGERVERSAPITLLYTSGTTGTPKGVVLTHANVLDTCEASIAAFGPSGDVQLSLRVFPLAHALERIAGHFVALYRGGTVAQVRSYETVAEDMRTIRPEYIPLVPRLYEKIYAAIRARAGRSQAPARRLYEWAIETGAARSHFIEQNKTVPRGLALRHALADRLVLRRIRETFGGRVKLLGSGGAPLSMEIARFFHAAGILICEAWGATETTAPATLNRPGAFRFGSVGKALPGVEVAVAADGELLVRGVNVFKEYFKDPDATADAFTPDGFYRTGDIGTIDADGYVYITDRKKELIITSAGKNIAPQKLENLLRERQLVSNCLVHCDRRPYVVALVTLDRAALTAAHPDLAATEANDPRIHDLLEPEVEAVNAQLARFEQIKSFRVVDREFSPATEELTLTLKLKRRVIEANYRDLLDSMYR